MISDERLRHIDATESATPNEIRYMTSELIAARDEVRELRAVVSEQDKIADGWMQRCITLKKRNDELTAALRWIWAFMYTGEGVHDGKLYPVYEFEEEELDRIRQILAAVNLPAPEEK